MKELKFELSVLFTKSIVTPYTRNELIVDEYKKFFGKEVDKDEVNKVVGEIIQDQFIMYNQFIQEIPEDYELK